MGLRMHYEGTVPRSVGNGKTLEDLFIVLISSTFFFLAWPPYTQKTYTQHPPAPNLSSDGKQ